MPNIVIIGGGPAGLSAAIYAVRAGMQATVLYKDGGALAKTDKIENYFGFIEPVSGAELLERGQKQAERLGAVLRQTEVTGIEYAAQGLTERLRTACLTRMRSFWQPVRRVRCRKSRA